jgi:hypothetical protein
MKHKLAIGDYVRILAPNQSGRRGERPNSILRIANIEKWDLRKRGDWNGFRVAKVYFCINEISKFEWVYAKPEIGKIPAEKAKDLILIQTI